MNYTWNCKNVEVYPVLEKDGVEYRDVLHTVHWEYTAEENGDSQTHIDDLYLNLDDMSSFVPYTELNNDIIAGWVEASLEPGYLERMQYALAKCITDRTLPASESRMIE